MTIQPFGEYRPDVTDLKGENTQRIENVIPRGDGYGPVSDITVYTDALPAPCRGSFRALNADGSIVVFAGTTTKLYAMDNTALTWSDVSLATGYALPAGNQWQFAQYGVFVIAVQPGNPPQVFQLGVSTLFAALGGTPPTATHVGIVNEFIVLTGILATPTRAQWCGRSAPTNWTAGTGESDFQDFPDGGPVGPIAGGEHGAILLQTYGMRQMTYQPGNPVIFSFDRISEDIGILAPLSVVKSGQRIFFISNAGFQQSVDGAVPTPIGKERVDNTFIGEWDANNSQLAIGFSDPRGTRVYWAYKTLTGAAGLFNKILCYDWALNRWTPITGISGEYIVSLAQAATTLEALDATGFTLDTLPISLDAYAVALGKEIAVFSSAHKIGFLRGPALEATLETAENGESDQQTFIRGTFPVTDAPTVFGQVSSRQNLNDDRTWNVEAAMDDSGLCSLRVETRYYRSRIRIPAGTLWSFASGVDPDVTLTGSR